MNQLKPFTVKGCPYSVLIMVRWVRGHAVNAYAIRHQRRESVIWIFQDVEYLTETTKTVYQGRSQGVSFRIAKGVYYRVGASRGALVRTSQMKSEGSGSFIITDRGIYFTGAKTMRIRAAKIVSITPFKDGVSIQRARRGNREASILQARVSMVCSQRYHAT